MKAIAISFLVWAQMLHLEEALGARTFLPAAQEDVRLEYKRFKNPRYKTGDRAIDKMSTAYLKEKLNRIADECVKMINKPYLDEADGGIETKVYLWRLLASMPEVARQRVPDLLASTEVRGVGSPGQRDTYYCEAIHSLSTIAPTSKLLIEAASDSLKYGYDYSLERNTCALEVLIKSGAAASATTASALKAIAMNGYFKINYETYAKAFRAVRPKGLIEELLSALETPKPVVDVKEVQLIHVLTGLHSQLNPAQRQRLFKILTHLSSPLGVSDPGGEVTSAALSGLGIFGADAAPKLSAQMQIKDPEIRAGALQGAANAGPSALEVVPEIIRQMDPFLGTSRASVEALIKMGKPEVAEQVRNYARTANPQLQWFYDAAARAIESQNPTLVREALAAHFRAFTKPGFVENEVYSLEILKEGAGKAFDPTKHRIRFSFREFSYSPDGKHTLVQSGSSDRLGPDFRTVFSNLISGIREGARVRLTMSPALSQVATYRLVGEQQEPGNVFEIDVTDVCEPFYLIKTEGSPGVFGRIRLELFCR